MGHEWVLWVLGTAAALGIVEEHVMSWAGWATFALGLAALNLINAGFFHVLPTTAPESAHP